MNSYTLLLTISLLIGCFSIYFKYYLKQPKVDENFRKPKYWGHKVLTEKDSLPLDLDRIDKFTVHVQNKVLDDLKKRLSLTRFSESIVSDFEYGMNTKTLKVIVDYWLTSYDWRKQEKILNQFEQYTTEIEGLQIHFIHEKPKTKAVRIYPLLLLHGWPSSFGQFSKIIPLLTNPKDNQIAFEVIVPSIPGFGFSEAPHKPGLDFIETARIFATLMTKLGHDKFLCHGFDWGSMIGISMVKIFPERIMGFHTTGISPSAIFNLKSIFKIIVGFVFPSFIYDNPSKDTALLSEWLENFSNFGRELGYFHIQATKPDTVGFALTDSPAGFAAYVIEKNSFWVNPSYITRSDGGVFEKFTLDEILTNIMIFWVTNSITSSLRFYKENLNLLSHNKNFKDFNAAPTPKEVPIGIAFSPYEFTYFKLPKALLHNKYSNIVHFEYLPFGGHLVLAEEPQLIANDLKKFVQKIFVNG